MRLILYLCAVVTAKNKASMNNRFITTFRYDQVGSDVNNSGNY